MAVLELIVLILVRVVNILGHPDYKLRDSGSRVLTLKVLLLFNNGPPVLILYISFRQLFMNIAK